MINLGEVIKTIDANASFEIIDNDINKIIWHSTPISKTDIEAKRVEVQAEYDANQYQRDRAVAYKELKEQLDLLYHDMVADKGDKTGEWFKHIKAVKDANPKE
jgi:hypothetical protein